MKIINTLIYSLLAIFLFACTSAVPHKVFLPEKTSYVTNYFINGMPIGVIVDDSIVLMAVVEPVSVADIGYMRLWLLYGNKMTSEYLLAPMEFASMTVSGSDNYIDKDIEPESPTKILADIEDEKVKASIYTAIGGALQTLSTQNTKVYDNKNKEVISIDDKSVKNEYILQKTKSELGNSIYYYDIFKESVNQGLLRRNTVFQYRSVNGYVYFPLYDFDGREEEYFKRKVSKNINKIVIKFKTPIGLKTIEFKAINGE